MTCFSLNSEYLENLRAAIKKYEGLNDKTCSIVINETFKVEIPVIFAASISSKIAKIIGNDPTATKFPFTIGRCTEQSLEKIKNVLTMNKQITIDEKDMQTFASFGIAIGNSEFVAPQSKVLEQQSLSLNDDNVVNVILSKKAINNLNFEKETSFIAENFNNVSEREDFIEFASNSTNLDVTEAILSCDKLKMESEDDLLSFIIKICATNEDKECFLQIFDKVFLEYCSTEKCSEFLTFINGLIQSQGMKAIINCIRRRLIQPKLPMDPEYIEGRHKIKCKKTVIGMDDPLNGILRREHEKGNVLMEASSTSAGSVYDLLKGKECTFWTDSNDKNSNVSASFKDESTFTISGYMIKGNTNRCVNQLRSWKVEGQKAENGQWIVLDNRNNEDFTRNQVRTFKVENQEKLKAVRLTSTGPATSTDFWFIVIAAFDIFGVLYK